MVLHEENQQTNKKLGQICFQYCPRYVSSDLRGPSTCPGTQGRPTHCKLQTSYE